MTRALVIAALLATACGDNLEEEQLAGFAYTWLGIPGEEGFNGDGHDRLDTRLYWSFDMMFHSDGTPYFIDWNNHLVRKVRRDGTVETVLGSIDPILPGDGEVLGLERTPEGAPGLSVRLNHPTAFAEADDGTILLMAWHNHKLRAIDPDTGNSRILCGGGAGFRGDEGPAHEALLRQPSALVRAPDGTLFIGDQQNFRVRQIAPDGTITTIAGNGVGNLANPGAPAAEDIPALESSIDWEAGSNPEPSGGLAIKGDQLFLAETLRHRIRVIDLTTGLIRTVAGTGFPGYSGDFGDAAEAELYHPRELEIGPEGDLYIADTDNNVIRAINLDNGRIRTVVGTGRLGLDQRDGLLASQTDLKRPFGLEFDPEGNLYVMDTINSRILKVPR
jgi:hypothetical protein